MSGGGDALRRIDSRRASRGLMAIVRSNRPFRARFEALYTLWDLRDRRAEPLLIQLCRATETEDEQMRDVATEALGRTADRLPSQRALAERLFDASASIRYAALCACSGMYPHPYPFPGFLKRALEAKLSDPDRVNDHEVIAELAAQVLGLTNTCVDQP